MMTDRDLYWEELNAESCWDSPLQWEDCPVCGAEGGYEKTIHVYEAGCGFSHPDGWWVTCETCRGSGGMICEPVRPGLDLEDLDDRCGELDETLPF